MKNAKENKVTNLEIYEKNLKKNYAIKGALVGVALSTLPIGLAVANNVLGMNIGVENTNAFAEMVNNINSSVATWPVATVASGIFVYLSTMEGLEKADKKIKQLKK